MKHVSQGRKICFEDRFQVILLHSSRNLDDVENLIKAGGVSMADGGFVFFSYHRRLCSI